MLNEDKRNRRTAQRKKAKLIPFFSLEWEEWINLLCFLAEGRPRE